MENGEGEAGGEVWWVDMGEGNEQAEGGRGGGKGGTWERGG